jgi:hypothetical protein
LYFRVLCFTLEKPKVNSIQNECETQNPEIEKPKVNSIQNECETQNPEIEKPKVNSI